MTTTMGMQETEQLDQVKEHDDIQWFLVASQDFVCKRNW